MTTFLYLLVFAIGCGLGGFIVYKFNPQDVSYKIGKVKSKGEGVIDVKQGAFAEEKKPRRKLFNRKNKK